MRILMLGGSGLLSGAARAALLEAGHDVTVLTRGGRALPDHPRLHARRGDRHEPASLAAALQGERFDVTVDFLAFDAPQVEQLLAVPGFTTARYVMISTGQVYLVTREPRPPFREADADAPEIAEPEPDTRAHANWVYGTGKRRAEAALRREAAARGMPALALRLPVVQGEEDGHASKRLWAWLERMRDGGPVLLPEDGVQPVRFVYSGDAARAVCHLAETSRWPQAPALNLAQPSELTLRDFLARVARLAGVPERFVPVDAASLEAAGLDESCAPYWGRWCSRPDPAAAFEALGFRTREVDEYLPAVVAGHLSGPPPSSHEGYAQRARELALAARRQGR